MSKPSRSFTIANATILVFDDPHAACRVAAGQIADVVRRANDAGRDAVLGLATGSTPVAVYEALVSTHRSGDLSFARATSYNLDEYYPISPLDPNSYRHYMHRHFFSQVDLPPNRAHVLDGTVPEEFAAEHCADFEEWIDAEGGLDIQLLGIGRNGHIGFNEPVDLPVDVALELPTRLVELHPITIADAARDFGGVEAHVPRRALTMGIAPILSAQSILLLAFGGHKAEAVAQALTGPVTAEIPASLLREGECPVTWILDSAAAERLG